MAIKIKKTNKFKEVEFKILKDEGIEDRKILTPDGFRPILAFDFIQRDKTLVILTEQGTIKCHPGHKFLAWVGDEKIELNASQLDEHMHKLVGYNNQELSFSVSDGETCDLYDIEVPSPHHYYTSGMVSHNSVFLVNNAISSLRDHKDVLFITFEMSVLKTALRAIGTATGVPLNDINDRQEMVTRVLNSMKLNLKKRLLIHEMPPEECSVAHIYALLDSLKRTEGWRPDVIILDYLDLMVSRNNSYNQDTYTRQKMTASEVRGLAIKENVLVFTATQTNRSGASGEEVADMTKAADSFAKQFSLDYVISLNQSQQERVANPPRLRMFIAKNRNGPKHELVQCEIQYETMVVREV